MPLSLSHHINFPISVKVCPSTLSTIFQAVILHISILRVGACECVFSFITSIQFSFYSCGVCVCVQNLSHEFVVMENKIWDFFLFIYSVFELNTLGTFRFTD